MIVVADTSPVNYLLLLGEIQLLQKLFGNVLIPAAVEDELRCEDAPLSVQRWMERVPIWLQSRVVSAEDLDGVSDGVDLGEREAIALALKLGADFLIIDDRDGRRVATSLGLNIAGTLGILGRADELGIVGDFPSVIQRLINETSFRGHAPTIKWLLERHERSVSDS